MTKLIGLAALIASTAGHAQVRRAERVPVELEISPEVMASIPPERRAVVAAIRDDVRRNLWQWDVGRFEYDLPATDFGDAEVVPADLFRTPDAGELPIITRTADGERIPLSESNARRMRYTAQILVPSRAYPGKSHVWQVRPFFQTGITKITVSFRRRQAFAYDQILVQIPARFKPSRGLNVPDGVRRFLGGFYGVMQAVTGFAETARVHSDAEIAGRLRARARESVQTVIGADALDVRLSENEFGTAARREVEATTRRFDEAWPRLREDLLVAKLPELRAAGLTGEALTEAARAWLAEQRLALVQQKIRANSTLERLAPGLGARLVQRSHAARLTAAAFDRIDRDVAAERTRLTEAWLASHRVRKFVPGEVDRAIAGAVGEFSRARWRGGVPALIDELRAAGFARDAEMAATFDVYLNQADEIATRLRFDKMPARAAMVARRLRDPRDWVVTHDERTNLYEAHDRREHRVTSHVIGWRAELAAWRAAYAVREQFDAAWTDLILNGRCGWRATFGADEFCATETIDRQTGDLVPDEASRRTTPRSAQRHIEQGLADLKESFERRPEGDISKDLVRPFVYAPYYALYGVQTALNFGGRTVGFLGSMVGGAAGVVSAPFTGALYGLGRWLLWDTFVIDSAVRADGGRDVSPLGQHLGLKVIGGAAEAAAATAAVPAHALIGAVGYGAGAAIYGAHRAWDGAWAPVLERNLYLPSTDKGVATERVRGPGLERNYEFKIEPSLALVHLRAQYEDDRLRAVVHQIDRAITEPERAAEASANQVYRAAHLRFEGAPWYRGINQASNELAQRLRRDEAKARAKLPLVEHTRHRVRLRAVDVGPTLDAAERLTREFWAEHADDVDWTGHSLTRNDFRGLAELKLGRIFGDDVLKPLEDGDDDLVYEQPTPDYGAAIDRALAGVSIPPTLVNADVDRDLARRAVANTDPRHASDQYWSLAKGCDDLLADRSYR